MLKVGDRVLLRGGRKSSDVEYMILHSYDKEERRYILEYHHYDGRIVVGRPLWILSEFEYDGTPFQKFVREVLGKEA